jgi:hypothetical protein
MNEVIVALIDAQMIPAHTTLAFLLKKKMNPHAPNFK